MRTLLIALMFFTCPAWAQPNQNQAEAFVIGELSSVYELDPAETSAPINLRILQGMYETLLVIGDDGMTLEPGAATSWEVSGDGLVYTFHLREEACWSNGDPVTSGDFLIGWFRALLPDTGGDFAALYFHIEGAKDFWRWRLDQLEEAWNEEGDLPFEDAVQGFENAMARFDRDVGVEVIDDLTLRITLDHPAPHFPYLVAMANFAPFPSDIFNEELHLYVDDAVRIDPLYFFDPDRLITNGPYRLAQFSENEEVRLTANDRYWNAEAVRSTQIIQRVYPDPMTLMSAYDDGDVHWVPTVFDPETCTELLDSGRDDVHVIQRVGTYYYEFNCRPEVNGEPNPFADRDFRRAAAHAFDRQAIAELVRFGATPLNTFVPPNTMPRYSVPADVTISYDIDEARRQLEQLGFADLTEANAIQILINEDGSESTHRAIAQVVSDQFELLGITSELNAPEFIEYLERSKASDFHLRRAGWFGDYQDPITFLDMFRSDDPLNDAGYENETFDTLIATALQEIDLDKRLAILREAEALLLEDAVIIPLYQYAMISLYDTERVRVHLNAWSCTRLEHLEHLAD